MLELDILDVAFGGKGIAKVPTEDGDFTVFVPNAIRGQRVRARVPSSAAAEARITAVLKQAPEEIEVPHGHPRHPVHHPSSRPSGRKERTTLDVYRHMAVC